MIRPAYLRKGDTVSILTTAKYVRMHEMDFAIKELEAWGLKVRLGASIGGDQYYMALDDEKRALDLQDAINDPSVKAILFARGGYGTIRIMNLVDFTPLVSTPKWLVGFSDLTYIHHRLFTLGIESIHGPMPIFFEQTNRASLNSLKAALFGELTKTSFGEEQGRELQSCSGRLIGGNLAIVASLADAEVIPKDSILFLEDIDEYLYQIDRMLHTLQLKGVFDRINGLLIGDFTAIRDNKPAFNLAFEDLFIEKMQGKPVYFGFPAGHDVAMEAMYFGRKVVLSRLKNKKAELAY